MAVDDGFVSYLKRVEGKGPDYARVYDRYLRGEADPASFADVERLQLAWAAWRRYRVDAGARPSDVEALPVERWIERLGGWDADLRQHVVAVRPTEDGVYASCVYCPDADAVTLGGGFHEEVARGAATIVAERHRRDAGSGPCVGLCPGKLPPRVLWCQPPVFRTWALVVTARGEGGATAKATAAAVADAIRYHEMRQPEPKLYDRSSGCDCGYLSVGSVGGRDCPACGLAG
jgi:hypothetical protein